MYAANRIERMALGDDHRARMQLSAARSKLARLARIVELRGSRAGAELRGQVDELAERVRRLGAALDAED